LHVTRKATDEITGKITGRGIANRRRVTAPLRAPVTPFIVQVLARASATDVATVTRVTSVLFDGNALLMGFTCADTAEPLLDQ